MPRLSPGRYHRSLIAGALLVRGIRVEDLMSVTRRQVHTLTPFAKVQGSTITYPAETLKKHTRESVGQTPGVTPIKKLIYTRT